MAAPVLAISGLRKSYRGQEALAGVNLEIRLRPGPAQRWRCRRARSPRRLAAGASGARLPGGALSLPRLVLTAWAFVYMLGVLALAALAFSRRGL